MTGRRRDWPSAEAGAKAYAPTAAYDAAISTGSRATREKFPAAGFAGKLAQTLRYGENPHQEAALLCDGRPARPGVARRQVQGKELSYNNINDADAALELVAEFRDGPPTVVIVKHANPCGVAPARPAGGLQRAGLRFGLGLRRHRRAQPAARRADRRSDLRDLHRSRRRARPTMTRRARSSRARRRTCACC
jgi:AICAR transformylase/IMP cyclohydrolase PurH